jgi:hypothetical protein
MRSLKHFLAYNVSFITSLVLKQQMQLYKVLANLSNIEYLLYDIDSEVIGPNKFGCLIAPS